MKDDFHRILYNYLVEAGLNETSASYLNLTILLVIALVLAWFLDLIIWKVLRSVSLRLARKSKTNFDNFLVANRVPRYLAHILPLSILVELVPFGFIGFEYAAVIALKFLHVLFVVLTLYVVKSVFKSINDYLKTKPRFRDKPMGSYIQVFMIFAWVLGIFTIFAIITEIQVWKFFTALGAGSAVILLIFKDSILGLVASIQVSINDMVRIGDWISFDKFGADGDVIEISLATVKVQNFDKTITTIPTYALISDSFKNWRGMQEAGGRRIKRALIISQKSIRFLSDADVEEFQKIQLIQPYLTTRSEQINTYNTSNNINKDLAINGRNLTNIGVFRKYVNDYLQNHSAVNKGMTLMVRQLPPTPQGIPLEIYAFSSDKRWENYEYVMADIFDHLIAALPYFHLQVYEIPVPESVIAQG
ncbi:MULTISPECIES: mechanosensitive ion channel family protein [Maribacter]|uniref:Mechanosensing system component YbdG n=1 Tax=Maribacter stanieri TaxID=440514 RepID=A0A1I6IPM0_9FLAO|nr:MULTISPECIES: mechanosensitive ion channel domain-containing protein [Maribacter]SFR68666.1 miniconductance mechanosensitive channel [Maribacter stanieri]|tara:strand:+ start:10441 stop:11694 length:1254 start_codon:yes stop_codon:yes gene_type:complete